MGSSDNNHEENTVPVEICILHLDDDSIDQILFQKNISRINKSLQITWAENCKEALDKLHENKFSCIVSDYQMPDHNGMEFLLMVRDKFVDIPFIFYTGQGNEELAAEAFRSGADDYYTKNESFAHYQRMAASIEKNAKAYQYRTNYQFAINALKQSDERLSLAGKAHYDIMYDWDLIKDQIHWFNKFEESLGFEKGEIDTDINGWASLLHPDDKKWLIPKLEFDKHSAMILDYEYRMQTKDGSYRFWQERGFPQRNEKGQTVRWIGVCRDITDRKKLEEKLQTNLDLLEESQRVANMGSYQLDFTTGMWLGSETLNKILGLSGNCLRDIAAWKKLVHPDDRDRVLQHLETHVVTEGNPFNTEYRIVRGNSEIVWVHEVGKITRNENGAPLTMIGVVRDITKQKQNEFFLQNENQLFKTLLDSMPILANAVDADGNIIYWNKECERVTGYSSDEIIMNPDTMKILYPNEDYRGKVLDSLKENANDFKDIDFQLTGKNGKKRTISWNKVSKRNPIKGWSSWAVGLDITDKRESEKKMTSLQHCLEQGEQLASLGSWVWDLSENDVSWSHEMFNICGRSPELGATKSNQEWMELIHPDDREEVGIKIDTLFKQKQQFATDNYRIITPDGKTKYISSKMKTVMENNQISKVFGAVVDVTDQKLAEIELLRAYDKIKGSNEDLKTFSYTVSHDLKSPLRRISGFVNILEDICLNCGNNEVQELYSHISDSCKKMTRLIDDILNLSLPQTREIQRSKVNLNALAEENLDKLFSSEQERKFLFKHDRVIWVDADAGLMKILMQNLIDNAWKYSCKNDETIIELGTKMIDNKEYIFVGDNGVGMEPDSFSQIFKPFTRVYTGSDIEGSGIGLATVKRIVEAHGGNILVESRPGEGTRMLFYL